jgi:hypothetical protein
MGVLSIANTLTPAIWLEASNDRRLPDKAVFKGFVVA